MKRVAVTGIGPISSLGKGCKETWDSIMNLRLNLVRQKYFIGDEDWGEFYLHKMRGFDIDEFDLPKSNFQYIDDKKSFYFMNQD